MNLGTRNLRHTKRRKQGRKSGLSPTTPTHSHYYSSSSSSSAPHSSLSLPPRPTVPLNHYNSPPLSRFSLSSLSCSLAEYEAGSPPVGRSVVCCCVALRCGGGGGGGKETRRTPPACRQSSKNTLNARVVAGCLSARNRWCEVSWSIVFRAQFVHIVRRAECVEGSLGQSCVCVVCSRRIQTVRCFSSNLKLRFQCRRTRRLRGISCLTVFSFLFC